MNTFRNIQDTKDNTLKIFYSIDLYVWLAAVAVAFVLVKVVGEILTALYTIFT